MLLLFYMSPLPSRSPLFPYTTLFRSLLAAVPYIDVGCLGNTQRVKPGMPEEAFVLDRNHGAHERCGNVGEANGRTLPTDRKSTRLNSSHTVISYAVFCLKKKKKKQNN